MSGVIKLLRFNKQSEFIIIGANASKIPLRVRHLIIRQQSEINTVEALLTNSRMGEFMGSLKADLLINCVT